MEKFWKKVAEKKENIRFYQSASYSPYSEFSWNWLEEQAEITQLGVNSFYRYDSIMQRLFLEDGLEKKWQEWLFDIYMHYLTEIEYRNGITIQEFQIRKYWEDLEKGMYGEEIKNIFAYLSSNNKYYIAHTLWRQSESRESVDKFAEALVTVLNCGIVYKNKWKDKQLLFYVNVKKNDKDIAKMKLIQQLFQPLGYRLHVLWEHHFAVVGEAQTMTINEIELL